VAWVAVRLVIAYTVTVRVLARHKASPNPFTLRERDVLGAMALGLPSAEIAARLHLSSGTVGNYISAIIRKAGTRNRLEAVRVAEESGWIWIPRPPLPGPTALTPRPARRRAGAPVRQATAPSIRSRRLRGRMSVQTSST
jgi:DNA-binding CsgD family transcriptional regulator